MTDEPNLPQDSEKQPAPPEGEPVAPLSEGPAENYILTDLKKTRLAIKRTQIVGVVALLLVGGELIYMTAHFRQSLQPHVAAEIADGIIMQQVNEKGPEFAMQLKQKIPEYLAQTPDYVKEQLPIYRESVEDKIETTLTHYCDTTSQQLGKHFDTYLDTHKEDIKGMLTAPDDPEALQQTGQQLREELMAYLREKPEQGESIQEQVNQSLASLQEFEKKMKRLATGKNLTPQEKKTRQVIAILNRSVNDQHLDQKAQDLLKDVKAVSQ